MRSMVGLVQRQGIFYYRRTIPDALRPEMPFVLASAGPSVFSNAGPISLKGSRAGREFWVSLRTRDPADAHARALRLEEEAQALINLAESRVKVHAKPKISSVDRLTIEHLVATYKHRKLASDEMRRRGHRPLRQAEFDALGKEIDAREAELRDANARGDCTPTHFDQDAWITVLEAGLNLEFGSAADRSIYLAFVETELDLIPIFRDRQRGSTRPTPPLAPAGGMLTTEKAARQQKIKMDDRPSVTTILEGWKIDHQPAAKTVYTFARKIERWILFLEERGSTFHEAALSDASDWKLASLTDRSAKSVSNDIYAVKAIYSWAVANGKCPSNPFVGLRHPRAVGKDQRRSTKRDFTDEEASRVLLAARSREGYRRWTSWIACFTGARISEICQLEKADIKKSNGIYYFDMTTEEDYEDRAAEMADHSDSTKRFKNASSKRQIPIHPKLIEEGFLIFAASCQGRYLFDDATPDRFGSRGGNATKVLSRWIRKELKIIDRRISPSHSFRHRFSTMCKNYNVQPEIRDRLMGHTRGEISEMYGENYWLSTLHQEICKIPSPSGL